jgi:hypothetical protein
VLKPCEEIRSVHQLPAAAYMRIGLLLTPAEG